MSLHKVKQFKTYQAVRVNQKMVSSYFHGDKQCMTALNNDAFFSPALSCMILKDKKTDEEKFIPLTNVQEFSLLEAVIKKNEPELKASMTKEEPQAAASASGPVDSGALIGKKTSKKTKAET